MLIKFIMMKQIFFILVFSILYSSANSQAVKHYNLVQLLQTNKLITYHDQQAQILQDSKKQAITSAGITWLKDVTFKKGTIEIDLRGKNIFLQSFLGIAFHGVDTSAYEAVYFRPFNFKYADTARRKWSVQYFSLPTYDYVYLRKEHPLMYENAVNPIPEPNNWFHATIVVDDDWIMVFVDHSTKASLQVKKLNKLNTGMIGLWASGLSGDFANLSIHRKE